MSLEFRAFRDWWRQRQDARHNTEAGAARLGRQLLRSLSSRRVAGRFRFLLEAAIRAAGGRSLSTALVARRQCVVAQPARFSGWAPLGPSG